MTTAPADLVGFDAAAHRFDDDEDGNPVLAHMRARAYEHLRGAFPRGSRLIELGSGTGTESSRLVRDAGCRVALVDPSLALLERAQAKVRGASPGGAGLLGAHGLAARDVEALAESYGPGSFDGAFSSMGALNCEPALEPVARGLATLLRRGAPVVLSIINRYCPTEVAWYVLHREWREARRRFGGPVDASAYPGGPKDVRTTYYTRRDIERAFAHGFQVEHAEAFPLLIPPPYLDFLVTRHRRLFRALLPVERWGVDKPVLRDLGDHVIVRLRRR